ncbi:MAG: glycine cleavage system aminomethyltransferase GcvT [Actinobacteria bacterium]|nr:glycine cleavage system aminomethyltransferase GcvT [Actinomycetota bacterium]
MTTGRASPLLEMHRELGAKLTEFGGWQMPLQYSGVIAEHNAVRTGTGVFDVSHLGKLRVAGDSAEEALQQALTTDVERLDPGGAAYALALHDDGGCIDDLFCYRMGPGEWMVVPNAANNEAVSTALVESGADVVDEWDRWAILALQGPDSFEVFTRAWPASEAPGLRLHSWCSLDVDGHLGFVARTGYTGERGFELYVPAEVAPAAWSRVMASGATPVGLGARDTLRLEMGYPLYGHELARSVNPLEAGLGWALAWDTPFRGRQALAQIKEEGPARRLFGIACRSRGVPRQGHSVLAAGEPLGEVTSGNFSPTLGRGIALAYAPANRVPPPGGAVEVVARSRRLDGDTLTPPFIER